MQGFIENHAQNFKLSGLWKVYGDEAYARAAFAKYKKCTDIYCAQLALRRKSRGADRGKLKRT